MSKALVVLSGGQDSTTCLAMAFARGFDEVHAITFDYGQLHSIEIEAALNVGSLMGVRTHEIINVGEHVLQGTSPLTNKTVDLERYTDFETMDKIIGNRVEKTFVPMRNALFLTIAANRAVVLGCQTVFTGVCEADNANYPDCRQSFIDAQAWAINEALGFTVQPMYGKRTFTADGIYIETPLMHASKAQSIAIMQSLGKLWLLAFTHTAYDGKYPPLGRDHASVLREEGFKQAGVPDPLVVRAVMEQRMQWPADKPNYQGDWGFATDKVNALASEINAARAALGMTV